jgi:hypothetical protein
MSAYMEKMENEVLTKVDKLDNVVSSIWNVVIIP